MGEAPDILSDRLQSGFSSNSKGCQTFSNVGDKTYVIEETGEGSALSIGVRVFDKSRDEWVTPVVLGTKPNPRKGHSAVVINDDRVLIVKKGSEPDDCIWFLEVDTNYVREQKKILGTEVIAWSKGSLGEAEKPVVISGPSGVGKGTLISMLMKEFPSMFGFSVSHTTRAPRVTEKDGVHYHFTDRSVMEKDIKDGKFLEFASVHGNLYGTSIEAVEVVADVGKRCILDIDVQGARSVRGSSLEAVFIFISPPSMEELEKRLRTRGTETEEQILKRLRNAKEELERGKSPGLFDHVLYNDNLEDCYQNLKKILGLDGRQVSAQKEYFKEIDLPLEHSVSKIENKILIKYGNIDNESSKICIVIDVSSIRGGAPGRTRGLKINASDSYMMA